MLTIALTGLLISCAMPATSWPIDAIFSERTSWSWARVSLSSVSASSRFFLAEIGGAALHRALEVEVDLLGRAQLVAQGAPHLLEREA